MANDSNFHRRAEWAPHKETILSWPGLEGTLKEHPERLARATQEVSNIAQAIAHFEPVTVIVGSERIEEAETHFAGLDTPFPIKLHRIEGTNLDIWLRDFAPTFVVKESDGSLAGLDWNFNGWGGRYPTPTTKTLAKTFLSDNSIERIETSIVTEGGALETDGDGTLLVTESSILNDNRNPGKSRKDVETELRRTLGAEKVIWIPGRKRADATDCHVDALARFVRPGVVLLSKANEVEAKDRTIVYEEAFEILANASDAMGRPFEIVEIEEPDQEMFPPSDFGHSPPVRSYVNYVLANGGIILPQFGDPAHDAAAIRAVQRLFGDERRIYPILIEELPQLGSGPHAATQEMPVFP
ncbi:peptidylarginine deiminase-like enzyme [Akanthomyces lecanii RCEF 1005]|uniref:Peptidylarginine deiminase-like enzyme n=1 Tax=Akanthomyces lecanii RCEF 1005 TaxID=1081108 RepID=A0A168H1R1_CORDF|nr:peptidylarginine deiminase-like enzyme [Akanthomyces lecanii RCEF 1005]